MNQELKQRVEAALIAAYKMRVRNEYPNATTVPSDEHYRQQAQEFMVYLEPLIRELTEREAKLVACIKFIASGCLVPPDGGTPNLDDAIEAAKATLLDIGEGV